MEENKIIITEPSRRIRHIAKSALKGRFYEVALGILIYTLVTTIACDIIDKLTMVTRTIEVEGYSYTLNFGIGSGLYNLLLMGAFSAGLCIFILSFLRRREIRYASLFDGFNYYGKTLGLFLLVSIKIILWSFLFIIPGIIAAIRYSQAFYILADHPEYRVKDCIEESKFLMIGNKWKFFCFLLSFIGWALLASIPGAIYNALTVPFSETVPAVLVVNSTLDTIIRYILIIPDILFSTYLIAGQGVFHDLLTGRLAPKEEVGLGNEAN